MNLWYFTMSDNMTTVVLQVVKVWFLNRKPMKRLTKKFILLMEVTLTM